MAEVFTKLFVAALPDSVSEQKLRQIVEATGGKVVEVDLPNDPATGRHLGFGFVTLSTPEEAESACTSLDGSDQDGHTISVRPFPGDGGQPCGEETDAGSEAGRRWWQTSELRCLRCTTVPLSELPSSEPEVAFFGCPDCLRHYTLRPGKQLTFRWPHAISLALYDVQLDESPAGRAEEVAHSLIEGHPAEHVELIAREIRLELEEPTQQVRDILDCQASETDLRTFLRSVASRIEATLLGSTDG